MHSIVPGNAETTTADTIYQVAEKEAFIAVLDIYAVELAKQSVDDVIEGKYRGYSSDARFGLDWTTHRVLVIPARGVDKSGKEIRGYRYDIRSSGSRSTIRCRRARNSGRSTFRSSRIQPSADGRSSGWSTSGAPTTTAAIRPSLRHIATRCIAMPDRAATGSRWATI